MALPASARRTAARLRGGTHRATERLNARRGTRRGLADAEVEVFSDSELIGWVEVAHAMVHGGPFPATSDSRSTSVGSLAIHRFLRPVCYQDFPAALLPRALADKNIDRIPRRIDGVQRHSTADV